jgi:signal transduction histidine kinase
VGLGPSVRLDSRRSLTIGRVADDQPSERRQKDEGPGLTSSSRVGLDPLLQGMLDRAGDGVIGQDRLRALLDAVVDLSTDLDLRRVLQRIVDAACELASCRYGALGVLAPDGTVLAEFITHGITDEERARIGPPPRGHGVLGLLIKEPKPIRLSHIHDHPQSYGYPANHPPMESFLGVPIRVHDHVYGNLYLTEKIGAAEFTDLDEQIVIALAAAAGVAIDNARLYEVTDRRRQWLQATTEISHSLLGQVERHDALRLIARKTREVSGCDVAAVLIENDVGDLVLEVAEGLDAEAAADVRIATTEPGLLADVLEQAVPVTVDDLAKEAHAGQLPVPVDMVRDLTYTTLVPLSTQAGAVGVLLVAQRRGSPQRIGGFDVELLATFANHVALALERVQAQADRALVAVFEDRDRIARDLHDLVIQRLFATGLKLQGMVDPARRPDQAQRLSALTDELDATIRDIRATIFELEYRPDHRDLRADIRGLAREYAGSFGFTPRVDLLGPVDSAVPNQLRPHALAVIREALSNAARHAKSTAVQVEVDVRAGPLAITVTDNGVGLGEITRESGLRNLRERAEALDGTLEIMPNRPQGTVVQWTVPVDVD